jgi:hypothetical protein
MANKLPTYIIQLPSGFSLELTENEFNSLTAQVDHLRSFDTHTNTSRPAPRHTNSVTARFRHVHAALALAHPCVATVH